MKSMDAWRRLAGISLLSLSGGMLLWGLTLLESRLAGPSFVIYWTLCVLFTFLALMVGLLDLRSTRMRAQQEKVRLMRETLAEIAAAAQSAQVEHRTTGTPATRTAGSAESCLPPGHPNGIGE